MPDVDEQKKFYVYAYLRTHTSENGAAGSPYYIGKGFGDRAFNSKSHRVKPPVDKNNIVFLARNLGEVNAFQLEMNFIHLHGRLDKGTGCLQNLTDGGEGASGQVVSEEARLKKSNSLKGCKNFEGHSHTSETKRKISAANTGRVFSEEHLRNLSKALKLVKRGPISDEHKRRISEANKTRRMSEETRRKISTANKGRVAHNKGKPMPAEQKLKLSASCKGRISPLRGRPGAIPNDETRRKMSEARLGKKLPPFSEEHRRNISEAAKRRAQREREGVAA